MHDLRSFLQRIECSGDLFRVDTALDPVLETTALSRQSLRENGPALLLANVRGSSHPMLGNLFDHRRRIESALNDGPVASLREVGKLLASLREPRLPGSLREALAQWPELGQLAHVMPKRVDDAAFNHLVVEGDDIDLARLPIQTCWPEDAGPLVTLGLVTTRGTRQKRQNVAIHRQQLIGPRRLIMRWLPHRGGALDEDTMRTGHCNDADAVACLVESAADAIRWLESMGVVFDRAGDVPDLCLEGGHRRPRVMSSTFSPTFCTSLPAPAIVLHAARLNNEERQDDDRQDPLHDFLQDVGERRAVKPTAKRERPPAIGHRMIRMPCNDRAIRSGHLNGRGMSRSCIAYDRGMNTLLELRPLVDVLLAMALGGAIGFEREIKNRPAGFRTHMLVAGAAALLVSVGMSMLDDPRLSGEILSIDPLRLAEAVIAGVSFIGAGTIFSRRGEESIAGITTAASLLMVAIIGVVTGFRYYLLATSVAVLTLLILLAQERIERWLVRRTRED